jgi:hypothetical protein
MPTCSQHQQQNCSTEQRHKDKYKMSEMLAAQADPNLHAPHKNLLWWLLSWIFS